MERFLYLFYLKFIIEPYILVTLFGDLCFSHIYYFSFLYKKLIDFTYKDTDPSGSYSLVLNNVKYSFKLFHRPIFYLWIFYYVQINSCHCYLLYTLYSVKYEIWFPYFMNLYTDYSLFNLFTIIRIFWTFISLYVTRIHLVAFFSTNIYLI